MLKFTDDHEWLKIEGGVATVGITAHATEQLGDLAAIGTRLFAEVRGRKLPVRVAAMPFVKSNYKRA